MASPMYILVVGLSLMIVPTLTSPASNDNFPCKVNNTLVDCSYLTLESVPPGIPEATTVLILSHNRLSSKKMEADSFKGLVNLVTLDVSYNSISSVESAWFVDQVNLQELIMNHNQINKLETTSFDNTQDLRKLDLSYQNNGMAKTSWFALQALSKLEILSLESVQLTSVNFEESIRLSSLKSFNIASNEIGTISNGDFAVLQGTNLDLLDLSDNPIKNIGDNTFTEIESIKALNVSSAVAPVMLPALSKALSNTAISKLVLQNIGLSDIKYNYFSDMENATLEEMDFSYNNITTLTGNSFGIVFRHLQQLDFYMNKIAHIEAPAFTNLTSLRVLDLSNNSLTAISKTMFSSINGSYLEELYLHKNSIQTISSDGPFFGLERLKYLKLSKNKIKQTFTGSEFDGLNNLEVLDLGLNSEITLNPNTFSSLSTLKILYINVAHLKQAGITPSPFSKLKSLVTLDLSNNSLPSLATSAFDDLISLETLYLQHNNLYSVWDPSKGEPRLFLWNLSNLKKLDLSWNGFKSIPKNAFFNLTNLGELLLGRNKISHISDSVFQKTKRLVYLELNNNEINVVNKTTLKPILSSLLTLTIGFNPFSCSCSLLWFRMWIDTTSVTIPDLSDCKCASPPDMVDIQIQEYHPNQRECEHKLPLYAIIIIGVGSLMVLVVTFVGYKFRSYCYFGYYYIRARRHKYELLDGDNNEFDYDAFVSHSAKDEAWVREHLEPELEQKEIPPFKLCLHYRDFVPGERVIDNITTGVDRSRRTLCLVSHHYLESNWCKFERKLGVYQLFAEFKDTLIVVLLEDIPDNKLSRYDKIHRTLKKKTYLKWPEQDGIDRHNFWLSLKKALRGERVPEDGDVNV